MITDYGSANLEHKVDALSIMLLGSGQRATRLLCLLSVFAFSSFAFVDPYMIQGPVAPLLWVRLVAILGGLGVFGLTFTAMGQRMPVVLGGSICIWTGVGVVVLTEMTGGAASPYWTMVMLTFFTVALVLPFAVPCPL